MAQEATAGEDSAASPSVAGTPATVAIISAPIDAPVIAGEIPLDDHPPASDMAAESWFTLLGTVAVRNVAAATLTPYLPRPAIATGAAVIVAPGGGFLIGAMENEGWPQARWLAERGVAAFVLKYRLQPTPAADDAFREAVRERFALAAVAAGASRSFATPRAAIEDGQAAIELVRRRASEWHVDSARVGWLGFSAGAMIGLAVAGAHASVRPAFLGAIYPAMDAIDVAAEAPPLFVAMAADDQLFGRQGYGLVRSWHEAGRPAELHVYERGGHGFGMGAPGTTTTGVMAAFDAWMTCGGWHGRHAEGR